MLFPVESDKFASNEEGYMVCCDHIRDNCQAHFTAGEWEERGATHLVDKKTGFKWRKLSSGELASQGCQSACIGLVFNPFCSALCLAGRTARIATCWHCLSTAIEDATSPKNSPPRPGALERTAADLALCVCTPLLCLGNQLASLAVCCDPTNDNRKRAYALADLQYDGIECMMPIVYPPPVAPPEEKGPATQRMS